MSLQIPKLVAALTHNHDAWVIGSAANPGVVLNGEKPRDWDVVVPFYAWGAAAHLIPPDATPNSFGGWKCQSGDAEVDVWPGDLGWLMCNAKCAFAWQPRTGVRWTRVTTPTA